MPSYNHATLAGFLTRDPVRRTTQEGNALTTFTVAVGRGKEVLFMACAVFGKSAEASAKFLKKGDPVLVAGRLRENRWDQDGESRSRMELIAKDVQFLKSSGKTEEESEDGEEEDNPD